MPPPPPAGPHCPINGNIALMHSNMSENSHPILIAHVLLAGLGSMRSPSTLSQALATSGCGPC